MTRDIKVTIEDQFGGRTSGTEIGRNAKYVTIACENTWHGEMTERHAVRFSAKTGRVVGYKLGFDSRRLIDA